MTAKEPIEEKLENLSRAIGSDEMLLKNVMNRIDTEDAESRRSRNLKNKLTLRRFIMNRFTKLTAAAVIIIAVVLTITFLDKSVTPAYAIEQTIEAFKNVNSVYVEQIIREKGTLLNTKMWARRGSNGKFFFGDFRLEGGNKEQITVVNESENKTYIYNPSAKTVRIYDRLNVTIGSFLDKDYFLHLQQEMEDVELEHGKDKITGKEVFILKYKVPIPSKYDKSVTKSDVITFDLETKLPIRWTSWDNPDFKGEPWSECTLIKYNPNLSEDTFKFQIPKDAKVIRE
jgi:outer membrane lipoprotein-sorting protein